jgi:hypothetical protein
VVGEKAVNNFPFFILEMTRYYLDKYKEIGKVLSFVVSVMAHQSIKSPLLQTLSYSPTTRIWNITLRGGSILSFFPSRTKFGGKSPICLHTLNR